MFKAIQVRSMNKQFILALFSFIVATTSYSQDLAITSPGTDTTIAACEDYFTTKWGEPLNMTSAGRHGNLLDNFPSEIGDVSSITYTNGVASVPATGNTPFVRLLNPANYGQVIDTNVTRYGQIFEVNPSVYSVFSMRMKPGSSSSSGYSVRWDTCPTETTGFSSSFSALSSTPNDWRIYSKDLSSVTPSSGTNTWGSGNKCGFAVYPSRNVSGATSEIDWIQLTKPASECSTATVGFSTSSGIPYRIFLDSDGSLANGGDIGSDIITLVGALTLDFSSSYLFPGTYSVKGVQSNDFMTLNLNPWDFSEATDIIQGQGSGISFQNSDGIVGGKICGTTTNTDPGFYLKFPDGKTADSSKFKYLTMNVTQSVAKQFEIIFYDASGSPIGLRRIDVPSGTNTVSRDLSSLLFSEAGVWTGQISGLRIDPGSDSGHDFCIDWISFGSDVAASEPSVSAATVSGAGNVIVGSRPVVRISQPDKRGDKDYFVDIKNNQRNFNDTSDLIKVVNVTSGAINPANSYTDNVGNTVYGDFLRIESLGNESAEAGDSQVLFLDTERNTPIDANLYKIACFDLHHTNLGRSLYQSMVRFLWDKPGGGYYAGDDFFPGIEDSEVRRTRGKETDLCVDLSSMGIEIENNKTVFGDYWKDVVSYFRLDPHEDGIPVSTVLKEVRLSSYHTTDANFSIVLSGARDSAVSLYYSNTKGATSGGSLIATISSGRNTDEYSWNTTGLTEGTYYLYATVGGNSFAADGPVVVDRSSGRGSDVEAPILSLLSPAADGSGRYATLDLSGVALDNRRIATIEVFIDGQIVHTFTPYKFSKETRDAYPTYPFASTAGFQESISLSGISDGVRTLRVDVWDTHGNSTSLTRTFTKASGSLTSTYVWPTYNDATIPVEAVAPTPTPTPTPTASLGLSVKSVKPSGMSVSVSNGGSCTKVQVKAASTSAGASSGRVIASGTLKSGKKTFSAKTVAKLDKKAKGSSKVYLYALCTSGSSAYSSVKNFDAKKYGAKTEKTLAKIISKLKLK